MGDLSPNAEVATTNELVKSQEVGAPKETLNPFQKAKEKFTSLSNNIRENFFRVKQGVPPGMLDPEQAELNTLSKSLETLNEETRQKLEGIDGQNFGIERATQKLQELKQKAKTEKGILPLVGMLGDGGSIEGQQIDFIKHPHKTMVHFKTTPQMTDRIRDEIIPALPPGDVTDGRYEFRYGSGSESVMQDNCWIIKVDNNTSIYVSKGSRFSSDTRSKPEFDEDGTREEDAPIKSNSLKRTVRIEVRGIKNPEEIAQRVNTAFQKLQIPDALTPPSQETENKYKEGRFRWQHHLQDQQVWETFRERYQRENGIDVLANLRRKEVYPGYYTVVDEKAENQYSREKGILLTTKLNYSVDSPDIASILKNGLMSSNQRIVRGAKFSLTNQFALDFDGGGTESVFFRLQRDHLEKDWTMSHRDSYFANKWAEAKEFKYGELRLIVNPKVLSRTDWFASSGESAGFFDPDDPAGGKQPPENLSRVHELMMFRGVPVEMFEGLVVEGELQKQHVLRELRSKGINEVNGVPIETFVIARTVDKTSEGYQPPSIQKLRSKGVHKVNGVRIETSERVKDLQESH